MPQIGDEDEECFMIIQCHILLSQFVSRIFPEVDFSSTRHKEICMTIAIDVHSVYSITITKHWFHHSDLYNFLVKTHDMSLCWQQCVLPVVLFGNTASRPPTKDIDRLSDANKP